MAVVKHNTWFGLEINGQEYRACWHGHGFSYATLRVDIEETYTTREFIFFGSKIQKKRWKTIVHNSREEAHDVTSVQNRLLYYDAAHTRKQVQNIVLRIIQKHTERI
jgi:hypothetical protein